MPGYNRTINSDPQTKQDWSNLLALLYWHWRNAKLPVTHYPAARCKGSLVLDGVIGRGRRGIGRLV